MALTKPSDDMLAAGAASMLGTAVAASGTSVAWTGLPAGVKRVRVMFNGVSYNGTTRPAFQLGTTGGYVSSGYTGGYGQTNSAPGSDCAAINSAYVDAMSGGWTASAVFTGYVEFTLLDASTNVWAWDLKGYVTDTGIGATIYLYNGTGYISVGGALDRVKMYEVAGASFDAGTINIDYS